MIEKTTRFLAGMLIPACSLGGCCSAPERGIVTLEPCAPPPGAPETQAAADLRADCQAISARTRQPEIIALSGGGSYGAWGAGVLLGWGENTTYPRPERFDVVTGISTGSLQSTFVFLGDYDELSEAYLSVDNDDIFSERGLECALRSNSFRDQTALLGTIEKWIPDTLIDRVATQAGARRLYVGTVDLDCGRFCIWDMVEVARRKDYAGYRLILLAAASIPVLAPPIEIDGHLHADAGVREQIFLKQILLPFCEAYRARATAEADTDVAVERRCLPPRLHLVVNGGLGLKPEVVENRILPLAFRSLSMVLDQGLIGNLCEIDRLVDEFGMLARVSWIPAEYVPEIGSEEFDPAAMAELHEHGRRWGRTNPWAENVPAVPFIGPKARTQPARTP